MKPVIVQHPIRLAAALLVLVIAPARAGDTQTTHNIETSGDLLQFGVPLAGLALSFLLNPRADAADFRFSAEGIAGSGAGADASGVNWPGPQLTGSPQRDFALAFARMEAATYGLKYSIEAERPNGGSESFPSGHTASAFMGAEFIRKEYGNGWGLPAYAVAGWVGYSRVESGNHYWRDVLGGALIGIAANHDFHGFHTRHGDVSIGPTLMTSYSVPAPAAANWNDDRNPGLSDRNGFELHPGLELRWQF